MALSCTVRQIVFGWFRRTGCQRAANSRCYRCTEPWRWRAMARWAAGPGRVVCAIRALAAGRCVIVRAASRSSWPGVRPGRSSSCCRRRRFLSGCARLYRCYTLAAHWCRWLDAGTRSRLWWRVQAAVLPSVGSRFRIEQAGAVWYPDFPSCRDFGWPFRLPLTPFEFLAVQAA